MGAALERARSMAGGRWALGPIPLAVGLAILSTPFVAWSLTVPPPAWQIEQSGWEPMSLPSALLLALVVVVATAVIGGGVAGLVLRRHSLLAVFVALAISWPLAIVLLPVAATGLGIPLRAGIMCIDSCNATLTDSAPLSGVGAYGLSFVFGLATIATPIAAIVLVAAAWAAGRRGLIALGAVLLVAAYALAHWMSLQFGGLVPFACLSLGVLAWTLLLTVRRPSKILATEPAWTNADGGG